MNRIARIGIDARKLKDYGIGSYIQNLLESLGKLPESSAYRFRVYARQSDADAVPSCPALRSRARRLPGYSSPS